VIHTKENLMPNINDLTSQARELLSGSIDIHVHASPDPFAERKMDARETVAAAQEAGMGGVVLKSHEYPTQPLAWALNSEFKDINVYGALALDHPVGGLNPDALETALRIGTKVIWWPTFDAKWSRDTFGRWNSSAESITVLNEEKKLKKVCHQLLDLMIEHDALLCSGHLSPDETLILLTEAQKRKIRTVITHATSFNIPLEVQQQLANQGSFIEQCGMPIFREDDEGKQAVQSIVDDVRSIGAEHIILSTDLGQASNPPPAVGFGFWIEHFISLGFSNEAISRMVQQNPKEAIG
jgi:hypothetical protein